MLTMREIDRDGFSFKNRNWNKRQLLEKQREAWSSYANQALEKAGVKEKIDHRSLEEQGINRIPQIHLGSAVTAMTKRGVETDKGDHWKAIAEANKQIESLERSLLSVEKEITAEKKLTTSSLKGQISEVRMSSGVSSSIHLNFDEDETDLEKPKVPSFSGRNSKQPEPKPVDRARTKYKNSVKLIHQELGENISDSRVDLEIYLRSNSDSEIIKQSSAYQSFEKTDPKIAECYLKAIAYVAGTYQRLSQKKTPDLDKWAKNLVNVYLAKFYAKENEQSQNLEQQQTKRRGLHL